MCIFSHVDFFCSVTFLLRTFRSGPCAAECYLGQNLQGFRPQSSANVPSGTEGRGQRVATREGVVGRRSGSSMKGNPEGERGSGGLEP